MKRLLNKIIIILGLLLAILIIYNVSKYNTYVTNSKNKVEVQKAQQVKAVSDMKKLYLTLDKFTDACHKENGLIVLEGTRHIQRTYTNQEPDIVDDYKYNPLKFMQKKFKELQTKEITVDATYQYEYVYDMDMLDPKIQNNKIVITISNGLLHLNPLAELENQTVISTKTHILSGNFTPSQTEAIKQMTYVHTMNQLNSDNKLLTQAINNAMEDIKDIAKKFGVDDEIEFEVYSDEMVENNEVTVLN